MSLVINMMKEKTRKKISKALKGKPKPWQKGKPAWNKGLKRIFKHTDEWKRKASERMKGNKFWVGTKKTQFQKRHLPYKGIEKGFFKKGQRPWNYKGGITPLALQIRYSFQYRQWRSDVFTRDDFTCVLCGGKGGRLEADHYPKRFAIILGEYQIKTLEEALNCEELWNINNGRTLCQECHHKVHSKFKE